MKKIATLSAAGAFALATAGGLAAEPTKKIDTDPFASTQAGGPGLGLVIAGGLGLLIAIVSADDT